jgi:hypothetical protein
LDRVGLERTAGLIDGATALEVTVWALGLSAGADKLCSCWKALARCASNPSVGSANHALVAWLSAAMPT